MKRIRFLSLLLLLLAVAALGVISASALPLRFASGTTLALPARASVVGGYTLDWWTVDGGGATSSAGGSYSLGGTIGQPDAGTSNGGSYALTGGFWGGGAAHVYYLSLPLIQR